MAPRTQIWKIVPFRCTTSARSKNGNARSKNENARSGIENAVSVQKNENAGTTGQPGGHQGTHSFWRRAQQAVSFPVPQAGGRGGTLCLLVCRVLLEADTANCFLSCASAGWPPGHTFSFSVQGPSGGGDSKLLPFLCVSRAAARVHTAFSCAGTASCFLSCAAAGRPPGYTGVHTVLYCAGSFWWRGHQAASFSVPQLGGGRGAHGLLVCRVLLEAGTASCLLSCASAGRPPGYTLSFGVQGPLDVGTASCFLSCASAGRPLGYTLSFSVHYTNLGYTLSFIVQGPSGGGDSKLLPFLCLSLAAAGVHTVFYCAGSFWRRARQAASFPVPQPGGRRGTHCLFVCMGPSVGRHRKQLPFLCFSRAAAGVHTVLLMCRVLLEAGTTSCFLSCASAGRPLGYAQSFSVEGPSGGGHSKLLPFLCLSRAAAGVHAVF